VALEAFRALTAGTDLARLVLLGRPVGEYGKWVLEQAADINARASREIVTTYDGYVHEAEYEAWLAKSDYVLLPQTDLDVFGRTKASAAFYDGLVRGLPVLVPEEMHFSEQFADTYGDGIVTYDDLLPVLRDLTAGDPDTYGRFHRAAEANASLFTLGKQRMYVELQIFREAACAP
jgi:hypothetical protein